MELPSSRASAPPSSTLTSIPHGQPPVWILQQPPGRALLVPLLFPSLPIPYVQNTSYTGRCRVVCADLVFQYLSVIGSICVNLATLR